MFMKHLVVFVGMIVFLIGIRDNIVFSASEDEESDGVNVILDTDLSSDVDDVGALATLFALEAKGEVNTLALGISVLNDWSPLAADAITTFYGRPEIPIGTAKSGINDGSRYAQEIAEEYSQSRGWDSVVDVPEVIEMYREVLSQQPDNSVTFVTIGPLTNAAALLKSHPCQHSDLNGCNLVDKKVVRWVGMGGNHNEHNMSADAQASQIALDSVNRWSTPVLFCPHGVGKAVQTGEGIKDLPDDHILHSAWSHYKGGTDNDWDHPSYDQCTVHYAVSGFDGSSAEDYYKIKGPGWYKIDSNVGYTGFDLDPEGLHRHIRQDIDTFDEEHIAGEIEELMKYIP